MKHFLAPVFLLAFAQAANAHAGHSHGTAPEPAEAAAAETAQATPSETGDDGSCAADLPVQDAAEENAPVDPAIADGAVVEAEKTDATACP